jgi:hypothetical protein
MYGRPEYDPIRDQYRCEICGEWYDSIPNHVKVHNISILDYKEKFGFDRNTTLSSDHLLYKYIKRIKDGNMYEFIREEGEKNLFKKGNKLGATPRRAEAKQTLRESARKGMLSTRRRNKARLKARRERLYKLLRERDERVQNK